MRPILALSGRWAIRVAVNCPSGALMEDDEPMADRDRVTLRVLTPMNTLIPFLVLVLAVLVAWQGSVVLPPLVVGLLCLVLLGIAVHLLRSGVAVVSRDTLDLRGSMRSVSFPLVDVTALEVAGTQQSRSLVHSDSLVVVTSDGERHPRPDFAQSSYARGHGRALVWLCEEVNGRLSA